MILSVHNPQKAAKTQWCPVCGEELKDDPEERKVVEDLAGFIYDKVVEKSEYSAFYNTDLEEYCNQNQISEMYFTGIFSGRCVYFTAVDAAYRRIQPFLATDAGGGPKESLTEKWQKYTLEGFKTMMGPLMTTEQLIKELNERT